jgi:hypothetical protein
MVDVRVIRVETGEVLQEYDNLYGSVVSGDFFATPAAGEATYEIQVRMPSAASSGGALCLNRGLAVEVLKR